MSSSVEWFASSRVLIVAGKGGVGKTTVGASVGVAAARQGLDVLLVELEGDSRLGRPFGLDTLGYAATELERFAGGGRLRARHLTAREAMREYLDAGGLNRLTGRLPRTGLVDLVTAAAPGLADLVLLGKIRQLEQRAEADLIVVDAPASGHALGFLMAPRGLAGAAASGPVRHQADLVLELLADGTRCQVALVTLPEEGPVSEVVDTAFALEEEVGVHLGPVVVNGCWAPVDGLADALDEAPARPRGAAASRVAAARFRLERVAAQTEQVDRLARDLPLPLVRLPYLFTPGVARAGLDQLADALAIGAAAPGPRRLRPPSPSRHRRRPADGGPRLSRLGRRGQDHGGRRLGRGRRRPGGRVVVLTIDPARRLAETLDLDGTGDDAHPVAGPWPGELWAAQLDPAATLTEVLRRHGRPGQADRILANPTFQAITHATPGISEYMAVERLHQLHHDPRFDLVVLDTPPSRHAIEFLDSPQRLVRFLDNRLYRTVLAPRSGVLRSASSAGRLALRAVARLVGMELVDNVARLFADLDGLDQGFRDRAAEMDELLTGPACRYRLVTTARPETVAEATWIGGRLLDRGLTVDAVVANRLIPAALAGAGAGGRGRAGDGGPMADNLAELGALARGEDELLASLTGAVGEPPVLRVHERARMLRGRDGLLELSGELNPPG